MGGLPVLAVLLGAASGCPQTQTQTPVDDVSADPGGDSEQPPLFPELPANRGAGEVLDVTVPLVGGESLTLESLRGRPVVLEISASWELGWEEAHAVFAELASTYPELEVIVVAAEPDDSALLSLPEGLRPGWDPAGALAAKLSVATFPTIFVLDVQGQISTVVNGWDDAVEAEVRDGVARVTAGR